MHIQAETINVHTGISNETIKPFVRTISEIDSSRDRNLPETEEPTRPLEAMKPEIALAPVSVESKKTLAHQILKEINPTKNREYIENARLEKIYNKLDKKFEKLGGIEVIGLDSSGTIDFMHDLDPNENMAIPGSIDDISIMVTLEKNGDDINKYVYGQKFKDPVENELELTKKLTELKKNGFRVTGADILRAKEEDEEEENENSYISFRLADAIKDSRKGIEIPTRIHSFSKSEIEQKSLFAEFSFGGEPAVQVSDLNDLYNKKREKH